MSSFLLGQPCLGRWASRVHLASDDYRREEHGPRLHVEGSTSPCEELFSIRAQTLIMEPHVWEGGRSSQTEGTKVYETPVPKDSAAGWATLKCKGPEEVSVFSEYSCLLSFVPCFDFFFCISTALHVFKAQLSFISLLKLLVSLGEGCFISILRVELSARSVFFLACASATSPSTVQEMSDKGSHKDANIRRMERKTSRESQPNLS